MLCNLRDIINPDVVINISDEDKTLIVKEDAADSNIKKLTIMGLPDNAFAFTLDHQPGGKENRFFKQLSCYINAACNSGVNKGCDLVIITQPEGECFDVLIFDLKSDKPKRTDTEKQLLNSELYLKYLMSMLECHYKAKIKDISYRRAIVTTDTRAKRKNPTYRPNKQAASYTSYKVRSVSVDRYKESKVYFGAL